MELIAGVENRGDVSEPSPASTEGRASAADACFCCEYCQKVFRRPEHLKRHKKSHNSSMEHLCSICGKRFARSDVLLRHEFIHRYTNRADATKRRQPRACLSCSRAREKCSRGEPCDRCALRSIDCTYRRHNKAGLRQQTDAEENEIPTREVVEACLVPPSLCDSSAAHQDDPPPGSADQIPTLHPAGNPVTNNEGEVYGLDVVSPQLAAKERYHTSYGPSMASPSAWRADQQSHLLRLATPGITCHIQNAGPGPEPGMNWLPLTDDWDMQWTSILELGFVSDQSLPTADAQAQNLLAPATHIATGNNATGPPMESCRSTATSVASGLPDTPSTKGSGQDADRGRLYATSSSARTTAYERGKSQDPVITGAHAQVPISKLLQCDAPQRPGCFPPEPSIHGLTPRHVVDPSSAKLIWTSTYVRLLNEFHRFNGSDVEEQSRPPTHVFPTIEQLDMVIQLFFSKFLPTLPILHETLSGCNEFWILTLAMATIGCHYTKTAEFDKMVVPLHDFLGSVLQEEAGKQREPVAEFHFLQAFLLSQIGLTYYGPTEMRKRALLYHGSLVRRAENLGLFSSCPGHFWITDGAGIEAQTSPASDATTRWHSWVKQETARRLGYAIWTVDIMNSYHFSARSLLPAQLPLADLPHDGLWSAPSEHEWSLLLGRTERNPPLASAVRRLFLDREVKPDLGEFGRTIVLHGVFHEVQQVKAYFQRPLSTWMPTAPGSSAFQSRENGSTMDLSRLDTYSAWRNASLDCVDVMHWWANGMIALQSGMEHTTVLHLHMSRVVLLVPIDEILVLIKSMTNRATESAPQISATEAHKAESEVQRWAHRDESKARLATIHCGCVFWHLRRFSVAAFYEAQSIYLATLALWAYSHYASRPVPNSGPLFTDADNDSGFASPFEPAFIWIDRPNDDEMVQSFVRTGRPDRVKAVVSGVGDIYDPRSPAKILKEGLRIIERVAFPWGRDAEYTHTLQTAARVLTSAQE